MHPQPPFTEPQPTEAEEIAMAEFFKKLNERIKREKAEALRMQAEDAEHAERQKELELLREAANRKSIIFQEQEEQPPTPPATPEPDRVQSAPPLEMPTPQRNKTFQ